MSSKDTHRNSNFVSVGEGIQEVLKAYDLELQYLQNWIKSQWPEIVGNTIANQTEKIFFKEDKLYVVIKSAALKQQLHLARSRIKELVHEKAGRYMVAEIIVL